MNLEGGELEGDPSDKKSNIRYTYGMLETADKKTKALSDNIFMPQVSNKNVRMETRTIPTSDKATRAGSLCATRTTATARRSKDWRI